MRKTLSLEEQIAREIWKLNWKVEWEDMNASDYDDKISYIRTARKILSIVSRTLKGLA